MTIYTKTGDDGDTALFGGGRVPKNDKRVEAYGAVDELNSFVGLALTSLADADAYADANANVQADLITIANLGGNFDLKTFKHFPSYDPVSGATKSYLISRIRQTVSIKALDQEFHFLPWEPIFTEVSQKYNMVDVENLARNSGFTIKENYYDSNSYFVDSIWMLAQ